MAIPSGMAISMGGPPLVVVVVVVVVGVVVVVVVGTPGVGTTGVPRRTAGRRREPRTGGASGCQWGRSRSAVEEPRQEAARGGLALVVAGAALRSRHVAHDLVDVLAAAGPGRLAAGPAGGGSTHGGSPSGCPARAGSGSR